ncbi:hypothetical protein BGZ54_010335 [Gamsiella multidivaricata]|nr:hypothetical protein BGZ54_010335 [Gamsiella multidivaricata]
MGELVDATPEDLKSKVYIEEKLFDAWYYGRTVLIGSGELNEIHDAVILANCLFELKDLGLKSISASFKAYYSQRYPYAIAQFQYSRAVTRLVVGQTLKERISRYAILNWLPHSYQQRMHHEIFAYRPQASFMARAENRGRGFAFPQRSAKQWTEAEIERRISAVWNKRASIAV